MVVELTVLVAVCSPQYQEHADQPGLAQRGVQQGLGLQQTGLTSSIPRINSPMLKKKRPEGDVAT